MRDTALTAFAIFLVTIDPLGMVPLFVALTHNLTKAERRRTALRSVGLATTILVIFALAGQPLLTYMGITLASFRIAGGILLLLVAIDMVLGHGFAAHDVGAATPGVASPRRSDVTVFPLAVPLIAGPGALTSAILLHDLHVGDHAAQFVAIAVMLGVLALVLAGFLLGETILKILGASGIQVFSRVLGIVLAAVAVNNVVAGLKESFPGIGGAG